jgi:hypothetical protein
MGAAGATARYRSGILRRALEGRTAMARLITIKGYTVKNGRVIKDPRRLSVSARLREHASKRVRVVARSPARAGGV